MNAFAFAEIRSRMPSILNQRSLNEIIAPLAIAGRRPAITQ
jgi:hypothetical protein